MSMHFRDLAERAASDSVITSEEILDLRRVGWSDGMITPEEAEAIFIANDRLQEVPPEWADFFIEALGDFIINGVEPRGYVSEEQADWLMARIDHDGKVESMAELGLLVRLFERAHSVPQHLRTYALEQIERAVLTGEGPTRCGGNLDNGDVTDAEAALLRRIIFSSASERPAAVSRTEAELLFRIKDQSLGANNSPEWKRLFAQGVGNYLMGFSSHKELTRERAAELEAFMAENRVSLGGFLARVAKKAVSGDMFDLLQRKASTPGHDAEVSAAQAVTNDEKMWLEGQIDANGQIDEFDQALLDFIAEENGENR